MLLSFKRGNDLEPTLVAVSLEVISTRQLSTDIEMSVTRVFFILKDIEKQKFLSSICFFPANIRKS